MTCPVHQINPYRPTQPLSHIPHRCTRISHRGGHPYWDLRISSNFSLAYKSRVLLVKTKHMRMPNNCERVMFQEFFFFSNSLFHFNYAKKVLPWKGNMWFTVLAFWPQFWLLFGKVFKQWTCIECQLYE